MVSGKSIPLGVVGSPVEAEFRALIAGLRLARAFRVTRLRVRLDNESLVRLWNGTGDLRSEWAEPLKVELAAVRAEFEEVVVRWAHSTHSLERKPGEPTADRLARRALGLGARRGNRG